MDLVISLSSPTTPLDTGIAPLVTQEAVRHFRALTPSGTQAVVITDSADYDLTAFQASITTLDNEDGTFNVAWDEFPEAIGYIVRTYLDAVADNTLVIMASATDTDVTPLGGDEDYTVSVAPIIAAPESAGTAVSVTGT